MDFSNNFFDSICQTSLERMHSAIIGWIFSKDCSALSIEDKASILQALLKTPYNFEKLLDVNVLNEFEHMDILIEGKNFVIAVETKLKSTEHDEQLVSYSKILKNEFITKDIFKVYLSLIEENHSEWTNILFDDLYQELNRYSYNNNKDSIILTEYLNSLKHLIETKNNFLENHNKEQYRIVFENGCKTKAQKRELNDYISKNQLETIFQKLFCLDIIKKAGLDNYHDWIISETHGVADIYKEIETFKNKCNFNFALQGGTFKIALNKNNYHKSKASDINKSWINVFEKYTQQNKEWKCQKPRSKGRVSLTKKWNKKFYELSKEEIIEKIRIEYTQAIDIVQLLKKEISLQE